jgi:hypothetical protein
MHLGSAARRREQSEQLGVDVLALVDLVQLADDEGLGDLGKPRHDVGEAERLVNPGLLGGPVAGYLRYSLTHAPIVASDTAPARVVGRYALPMGAFGAVAPWAGR